MTASMALASGRAIWKKKRKSLQPSMCAASSSSPGMLDSKNVRAIIMFQTLSAPGKIMAQRLPLRPRLELMM